jgi:hypothetical protein
MSLCSKMIGYLQSLYNTFQSTVGGISIRNGSKEGRFYDNGTDFCIDITSGALFVNAAGNRISFMTAAGGGGTDCFRIDCGNGGARFGQFAAQFGANTSGSDASVYRLAAGVLASGTGGASGAGWFQNTAGDVRVTADVTNATTTFSNITDLSVTLIAGRKYSGRLVIKCSDSTAADGIKFDFGGGSATMTSFAAGITANIQGATLGVTDSSALATAFTATAMNGTGNHWIVIEFALVCNAAGTLIPRFAQNSHSTGTATLSANSKMIVKDMAN